MPCRSNLRGHSSLVATVKLAHAGARDSNCTRILALFVQCSSTLAPHAAADSLWHVLNSTLANVMTRYGPEF